MSLSDMSQHISTPFDIFYYIRIFMNIEMGQLINASPSVLHQHVGGVTVLLDLASE